MQSVTDIILYRDYGTNYLIVLMKKHVVSQAIFTGEEKMNATLREATKIEPQVAQRRCGSWLAFAPRTALFRIGVTAKTKIDAKDEFRTVYSQWIEILNSEKT
jgi:hypothetical protein